MPKALLDRRWPWAAAALLIALAFLSTIIEVRLPGNDPRPPGSAQDIAALAERDDVSVLFLLIDTLRADRLGAYGYARDTSPEIDRLARTGVRFARHLAQSSWTKASMASLWTGLYPLHNGVTRFDHALPVEARLPAEILREAGFRTAGVYRNGWVAPTFGFERGFEVYTRPAPLPIPPAVRRENPTVKLRGTDFDAVAAAVEFLRVHGSERWLLYLHLMDVHEYTYDAETALFGDTYSDIYDNSIRWVDAAIGELLAHLRATGLAERTLVVLTSDHGEAFQERGFEGHAREVYRETTEVPLLLGFPFRLEAGLTVETRTRNVDVWPTVLDLLGLTMDDDLDGRSLVPEILAAASGTSTPGPASRGLAHLDQHWGGKSDAAWPTVAVVEGPLRYVMLEQPGQRVEQLFDAEGDDRELEDRAAARPADVERLRAIADRYLDTPPRFGPAPRLELDELELNQLRALGYEIP